MCSKKKSEPKDKIEHYVIYVFGSIIGSFLYAFTIHNFSAIPEIIIGSIMALILLIGFSLILNNYFNRKKNKFSLKTTVNKKEF